MSPNEWEQLCDGCARCCLIKLEDEDTGHLMNSDVHCKLLDAGTCRCSNYENRKDYVKDCVKLTPEKVSELAWIPTSCAYRRIADGRGLADWHPLISGDPKSVIEAGISVFGRTVSEADVDPDDWIEHIAIWPNIDPNEEPDEDSSDEK